MLKSYDVCNLQLSSPATKGSYVCVCVCLHVESVHVKREHKGRKHVNN